MIDTLLRQMPKAVEKEFYKTFHVKPKEYAAVTLHRPSNVDKVGTLKEIIKQVIWLSARMTIIFVLHPRTKKILGNLRALGKYQESYITASESAFTVS